MHMVYVLRLNLLTYTSYVLMESIFQNVLLKMWVFIPGEHGWKTHLAQDSLKNRVVGLTLILEKV